MIFADRRAPRSPPSAPAVFLLLFLACLAGTGSADAQTSDRWTYRVRLTEEVTGERANTSSPFRAPTSSAWQARNLLAATADTTVTWRDRLKVGAGLGVRAAASDAVEIRAREAYARWSARPWLDVEAGRRIVRWGTGYAFTPTGVLDPPRDATDPQDRLGLNGGVVMIKADAYAGAAALTLVASAPRVGHAGAAALPRRLYGARVGTTIRGVEVAFVSAVASGTRPAWGANFTHVIGDRFEWHGEVLSHEDRSSWRRDLSPGTARARRTSALIGCLYTFPGGPNLVVEYYRDGSGLESRLWDRLIETALQRDATGLPTVAGDSVAASARERPGGRDFLFIRAARSAVNATISADAIAIVGLNDGGIVLVPSLGRVMGPHVEAFVRAVILTGPERSASGSATIAANVTTGIVLRF